MIQVVDLEKNFRQVRALRGVSLDVPSGQITGLLGPNACGKTTLIKSILGLVVPDGGKILIDGRPVLGEWTYRQKLGYMPQNPDFPVNLTISELLDMLEDIRDSRAIRRRELVELFELESFLQRPFGVLSGGTKQKVAAVSAFMFDPEILILDEPTVGLDPAAMFRIKGLMVEAAKAGKVVLLVSHIMSEVEQLVTQLVFLLDGSVLFSGSLEAIRERAGVSNLEEAVVKIIAPHSMVRT